MKEHKVVKSGLQQRRKERIVLIAAELFLQNGIEEIKMTDIADAAEIGVASLYRYFGTKTAIAIEVGVLLWRDLQKLFDGGYAYEEYETLSGLEQISRQLGFLRAIYSKQPRFMAFLDDFDRLLLSQKPFPESLSEYEQSIVDIHEVFKSSCEKGVSDGSIRAGLDYEGIYRSLTHSIIALSQKFIRGEILPGDDFSHAEQELRQLEDMALYYLRGN